MSSKHFNFDLYRLNIDADESDETNPTLNNDKAIGDILSTMASPSLDIPMTGRKSTSTWGVRLFETFVLKDSSRNEVVHRILLVKSLEEQDGSTLTDVGLTQGRSMIDPPLATSVSLYFWMRRHLVAVEHNATLLSGKAWNNAVRLISKRAAKQHSNNAFFILEPVPEADSITNLLATFSRVFRIKAKVRIPNPELTRFTKAFYEQLKASRINEYKQDMRNKQQGLSLEEGTLARATIGLVEEGYKDGDVTIVGYRKDQVETVVVGHTAARGTLRVTKESMRQLTPTDDSIVMEMSIGALLSEINRIKPIEAKAGTE